MNRPRIFLADDHRIILEAFHHLLEPKYEVVGTATDGREMLSKVAKLKPDIIILDIAMPNLNGLDAARKLKKRYPDIRIIFLTSSEEPELVAESLRIGANGYLLKNSDAAELDRAIGVVLKTGTYVTPQVIDDRADKLPARTAADHEPVALTVRQREVLQLLAEGKTMKEVAAVLCITPRTVAFHKYKIMRDLNLSTNSELIQYAIKKGLAC